jgi:hypothetical protein
MAFRERAPRVAKTIDRSASGRTSLRPDDLDVDEAHCHRCWARSYRPQSLTIADR